jgi:hypothetical protein
MASPLSRSALTSSLTLRMGDVDGTTSSSADEANIATGCRSVAALNFNPLYKAGLMETVPVWPSR